MKKLEILSKELGGNEVSLGQMKRIEGGDLVESYSWFEDADRDIHEGLTVSNDGGNTWFAVHQLYFVGFMI